MNVDDVAAEKCFLSGELPDWYDPALAMRDPECFAAADCDEAAIERIDWLPGTFYEPPDSLALACQERDNYRRRLKRMTLRAWLHRKEAWGNGFVADGAIRDWQRAEVERDAANVRAERAEAALAESREWRAEVDCGRGCQCDPLGSGEEHCVGTCQARAEAAALRERVARLEEIEKAAQEWDRASAVFISTAGLIPHKSMREQQYYQDACAALRAALAKSPEG